VDFKSEAGTDITCTVRKERLYEMNRCLTFVHLTDNWITKRCACDPPAVARKADEKADSPGADRWNQTFFFVCYCGQSWKWHRNYPLRRKL